MDDRDADYLADRLNDDAILREVETLARRQAWNWMLTVIVCILSTILALNVPFVTPKFMEIFADFDTELPVLTQLVVSVPWWAYLFGFGMIFIGAIVKELAVESLRVRLLINYALALPLVVFLCLYPFAMFLPLVKLIQSVSQ